MKLNNKGLSLVEVVVYMIASIFIIGYLFNTMTNITTSFHQERKKTNLQMDGQDAISMLARDISTTGFKHYLAADTVNNKVTFKLDTAKGTYLASYGLNSYEDNDPSKDMYRASLRSYPDNDDSLADSLTIFRAKMKDAYNVEARERITFALNENTKELTRSTSVFPENGNKFDDWAFKETLTLATGVVALKFFYSEDYQTWEDNPTNPEEINYIQIKIVVESEKEGNIINKPLFDLGEKDDGDPITFTPEDGNKHYYRLYERIVEVPSNGRI